MPGLFTMSAAQTSTFVILYDTQLLPKIISPARVAPNEVDYTRGAFVGRCGNAALRTTDNVVS
jgi:hypothetical protein